MTITRSTMLPRYERLTGDEDARARRDIPDAACREQPTSFFLHLGSALPTKVADELSSARLVIAWLLTAVGAPAFMAALLVPVRESGSLLPQLAIAGYLRRLPRRKWAWVAGALAQSACLAAMGTVPFLLAGAAAGWTVIALLAVLSLARGVCSVAHKDVLGKTIDRRRRGTVMGYAGALVGLAVLGVGAWLASIGGQAARASMFPWLLGGACLSWVLAAALLGGLHEEPGSTAGGASALVEALRSLDQLRRDVAFRHFVFTRALMLAGALAMPFYVAQTLGTVATVFVLALVSLAAALSARGLRELGD